MPILNVDILSKCDAYQKKQLIERLTKLTYDLLNIPPEKIVVLAKEYESTDWGRAGIVANDDSFEELSRRKSM
ncbi:tautomerase family protein [Clostridium sp.]|uniref:tautomerase family protein n=1 Tax=Clostridium sp. TaxID=1506 RepID=UPI00261DC136|nr:tautomerase family protein [Clostridium sp.]